MKAKIDLPLLQPDAEPVARKPAWLKVRAPGGPNYMRLKALMRAANLHSVCEEARCPNIGECWEDATATFMILGDVCTRNCGYCAIAHGRPVWEDREEPERIGRTVADLALEYVVITSVNRDDLADGGAAHWAATIRAVRRQAPACRVEVLIPDFQGSAAALETVIAAAPHVLNHNTETVPRLYRVARHGGRYERTLALFRHARAVAPALPRKSGIILGLGEERAELLATMRDLVEVGVSILTLGQYLRPSPAHLPVAKYYHPDEFAALAEQGRALGFTHVESGPLVRSSYHAKKQIDHAETAVARTAPPAPTPVVARAQPRASTPVVAEAEPPAPTPVVAGTEPRASTPVVAGAELRAPTPVVAGMEPRAPTPVVAGTKPRASTPVVAGAELLAPTPVVAGAEPRPPRTAHPRLEPLSPHSLQ